jgi:hypothetical protein
MIEAICGSSPIEIKQSIERTIEMSDQPKRGNSLREMELEVEAEGREWMRQRLEQKLQAEADREGRIFPPQRSKGQTSAHRVDAASKRKRRP